MYSAYVSFSKVSKFLVSIIKTIDLKDSIKGVFFSLINFVVYIIEILLSLLNSKRWIPGGLGNFLIRNTQPLIICAA